MTTPCCTRSPSATDSLYCINSSGAHICNIHWEPRCLPFLWTCITEFWTERIFRKAQIPDVQDVCHSCEHVFMEFWTAPIFRKAQISYVQDVCLSGEHFLRNFGLHQFCVNHKFLMCLSVPMCDVVYWTILSKQCHQTRHAHYVRNCYRILCSPKPCA